MQVEHLEPPEPAAHNLIWRTNKHWDMILVTMLSVIEITRKTLMQCPQNLFPATRLTLCRIQLRSKSEA
jgi:hypothetical protein